ncbi:MAG: aminoglycoside phosphotransferase family protein [Bdellovibrionaceae bacterium]|nr:aminoglycoside phosphotransferase family protein [Pseudobdellovibrionaceae bacterium]NUM59082.1 phosphotransferase [Pseudobdellovibrionaceae bacterium]
MNTFEEKITSLSDSKITLSSLEKTQAEIAIAPIPAEEKNKHYALLEDIAFSAGIDLKIDRIPVAIDPLASSALSLTTSLPSENVLPQVQKQGNEDEALPSDAIKETVELGRLISEFSSVFDSTARGMLLNYKKFFIFKIGKYSASFNTILLHDNIPMPEVSKKSLKGFTSMLSLQEFIEELDSDQKGGRFKDQTNLILLLASDFSSDSKSLLAKKEILESFEVFKFYEISLEDEFAKPYEYEGDRFLSALESDLNISLSNTELSKSEESLVKSFFPATAPSSIQYKLLKGGFSGSKVIEVSQVFSTIKPCRFVIKIDLKRNKKIATEEKAVKQWVSNLVTLYQTEKKENATHEALKYQFASSDGKRESISFNHFFKENSLTKISTCLESLLESDLFREWEATQFKKNQKIIVQDLFKALVDLKKVSEWVDKISFENASSDKELFSSILSSELPSYVEKVCHGDLHSENIIIDQDQVFLIDFGMTGSLPCFLDYATLETSIRLKLTPNYLPTKVLLNADDDFLFKFDISEDSIDSKISDPDLKKSYKIISKIRSKAIHKVRSEQDTYGTNEELELNYLLSLFCLLLRNLKYTDLNQKYAIQLARKVGENLKPKLTYAN